MARGRKFSETWWPFSILALSLTAVGVWGATYAYGWVRMDGGGILSVFYPVLIALGGGLIAFWTTHASVPPWVRWGHFPGLVVALLLALPPIVGAVAGSLAPPLPRPDPIVEGGEVRGRGR
jgi:hypothetical protein